MRETQATANQFAREGDTASSSHPQGQSASPSPRARKTPTGRKRFLAHRFVIWDAGTQEVRFCVPADRDGGVPVGRLAGMLAMLCLALKRRLEDFEVLVVPQSGLPSAVFERAGQLIAVGRSIKVREKLSALDEAILDGIAQNLRNKEIAAELNISMHTVRAHVSSLLAKFGVSCRRELGRQLWTPAVR